MFLVSEVPLKSTVIGVSEDGGLSSRFQATRGQLQRLQDSHLKFGSSQGHDLALTGLPAPRSPDSGCGNRPCTGLMVRL
jgi:hypothetical protein